MREREKGGGWRIRNLLVNAEFFKDGFKDIEVH